MKSLRSKNEMKITKAKLKQIIVEELEAVMKEKDEETTTKGSDDEKIEEIGLGGMGMPASRHGTHRDRPGYRKATVAGKVAGRTPTLDAAADALGMSPVEMMKALADEMGVGSDRDADAGIQAALPVPEGG
jgi:hypothetical protein